MNSRSRAAEISAPLGRRLNSVFAFQQAEDCQLQLLLKWKSNRTVSDVRSSETLKSLNLRITFSSLSQLNRIELNFQ